MSRWSVRAVGFLVVYAVTAVVWLAQFPLSRGDFEPLDLLFATLGIAFAGGAAVLVFTLELPVLEIGWGIFTYSYFVRFLDAIAEGPEIVEATLPSSIQLVGLAIILLGFVRSTSRLRADLAERNERLSVLNRVLRHNLRNELTPIIASFEYLLDRASEDDDRHIASTGLESARDLAALGDKARMIDRNIGRSDEVGTETFDLVAVVESVVADLRDAYPAVAIDLTVPSTVTVAAAPGLESAVENVVENACKHADADEPSVTVTVAEERETVTITVADDGPGIPETELDAIRERDISALDHGTGLGLWYVAWYVEKIGGDITFEYTNGQIVRLEFPTAGNTGLGLFS